MRRSSSLSGFVAMAAICQQNAVLPSGRPLAAAPAADSWERHRLIFDNAPLDEVLAQLNRYFPGHLHASGDDLARLRFTGALPADDVDKALRLLAEVLPLRVERHSRWLIRVRT